MRIIIKNLGCPCCIRFVQDTLESLNIAHDEVCNSGITMAVMPSEVDLRALKHELEMMGLAIVDDKRNSIVEQIKSIIQYQQHQVETPLKINLSAYLSELLQYNYSYLSNLFSETEGITIRDYVIHLRIERVKRMLIAEHLDLLEITYQLHYSSVAHLAAQFKQVTGMTTTEFKKVAMMAERELRITA